MKPIHLATLLAVAAFGLARADNPPSTTTTPSAGNSAPAASAAGAPATAAAPAAHTPAKAQPPWKMYMRNGEPKYCREVPISSNGNSRITETKCVNETDYIREQEATARTREALQQGSHGCQPNCGH